MGQRRAGKVGKVGEEKKAAVAAACPCSRWAKKKSVMARAEGDS